MTGYKAFAPGLTNQYGQKFEIGKSYYSDADLEYQKTGYYFCRNLEDIFRYYNGFDDIVVAKVKSTGNTRKYYDEYNEYEVISSKGIEILKVLSREEIISYGLKLSDYRLARFVSGFKLTDDEIDMFLAKDSSIYDYIEYYQKGNQNAFSR